MFRFDLYSAGLKFVMENKNNMHKNLCECNIEEENGEEEEER